MLAGHNGDRWVEFLSTNTTPESASMSNEILNLQLEEENHTVLKRQCHILAILGTDSLALTKV